MGVSHIALANYDRAFGHETEQAVGTTPVQILFPWTERIKKAVIQVLDADIVYADGGTTPTLTTGIIVPAGDILVVEMDNTVMKGLFVRVNAVSGAARVRVAYYGA